MALTARDRLRLVVRAGIVGKVLVVAVVAVVLATDREGLKAVVAPPVAAPVEVKPTPPMVMMALQAQQIAVDQAPVVVKAKAAPVKVKAVRKVVKRRRPTRQVRRRAIPVVAEAAAAIARKP